jgi:hypothetical protein
VASSVIVPDELLDSLALRVADLIAERATPQEQSSPWLNTKSAAAYLDWTEDALRAAVKRGQLVPHRTPAGRLLFRREELDAYALGDEAA